MIRENKIFSIYFLGDPVLHEFRYVGQTFRDPEDRLRAHINLSRSSKTYVHCWIRSLLNQGLRPQLFVINRVETREEADILEKYWIKKLREIGCPLTNLTDGGEGATGFLSPLKGKHRSEETKKKIAGSNKGKPKSEEHKRNMSKARKGIPFSEERRQARKGKKHPHKGHKQSKEARKQISKSLEGRPCSKETRQKISKANTGKRRSEETKLSMSKARKGRIPWNKGLKGTRREI